MYLGLNLEQEKEGGPGLIPETLPERTGKRDWCSYTDKTTLKKEFNSTAVYQMFKGQFYRTELGSACQPCHKANLLRGVVMKERMVFICRAPSMGYGWLKLKKPERPEGKVFQSSL